MLSRPVGFLALRENSCFKVKSCVIGLKLNVEDILLYGLLLGSAWLEKHCESLLPIVEKNLLKQDAKLISRTFLISCVQNPEKHILPHTIMWNSISC